MVIIKYVFIVISLDRMSKIDYTLFIIDVVEVKDKNFLNNSKYF
jgi:hypothetical protein